MYWLGGIQGSLLAAATQGEFERLLEQTNSTLSGCAEARGAALHRPEKCSRTAVYAALFQAVAPCLASLDPNLTK